MSLRSALNLVLEEYPAQSQYTFAGNDLASFIRTDLPKLVRQVVGSNERYEIRGSAGKGNWARCPWVAIFDRLVTTTAQEGYYVVYLPREDFSGIYLSLNQGVTTVRDRYGSSAKEALLVRSADYLAQLGTSADGLFTGPIDLATTYSASLASHYEAGNIAGIFYDAESLPTDNQLAKDLSRLLGLYADLVDKEVASSNHQTAEDDEDEHIEDLRNLRLHKRVERNRKLASQAKKVHGYTCQVCRFDFERHYGAIGHQFIEAHHLTPLSELRGKRLTLDPEKDFAVLCANCHRMIHRSDFVSDIEAFRGVCYRK